MGKVLVELEWFDLIECPDRISENIEEYAKKFDDLPKRSGYKTDYLRRVYKDGSLGPKEKCHNCYNTESFIRWLNDTQLMEGEKEVMMLRDGIEPTEEEYKLPHIYF